VLFTRDFYFLFAGVYIDLSFQKGKNHFDVLCCFLFIRQDLEFLNIVKFGQQ